MDIPAYGEKNLAKRLAENDKKISMEPCQVGEREKVLKKWEEQVKTDIFKNLIYEFWLIENQFRLIKIDRGSLKNLKQFQKQFRLIEN